MAENGGESDPPGVRMGLWIPELWQRLKHLMCPLIDTKSVNLRVYSSNDEGLLPVEIYNLIGKQGNLFALCSNFKYCTHLKRAIQVRNKDGSEEQKSVHSQRSAGASQSAVREISNSSDEEDTLQRTCKKVAIMFLIFTKDDVLKSSAEALRQNVIADVEMIRSLYPGVTLLVLMHGIRLYALHGGTGQSETELSQHGSQGPVLHSATLDDLICSLMIEHQVDTTELEDDVELANYLVNAAASVELCFHRKSAMEFRAKPQINIQEELPAMTKTWLTQLLQIPDVGKDAAYSIASVYNSPAEVMEAVGASPEEFIESLRSVPVGSKGTRKLGSAIAKRIAALYSENTVPSDRVIDSGKRYTQ